MAVQATFYKGNPEFLDYTPSGALDPAQVVILGQLVGINHRKIAASELGALAVRGGIYFAVADGAITEGAAVYWNDTTNKLSVTANSGANRHIGFGIPGSTTAADGDTLYFHHNPCRAAI